MSEIPQDARDLAESIIMTAYMGGGLTDAIAKALVEYAEQQAQADTKRLDALLQALPNTVATVPYNRKQALPTFAWDAFERQWAVKTASSMRKPPYKLYFSDARKALDVWISEAKKGQKPCQSPE